MNDSKIIRICTVAFLAAVTLCLNAQSKKAIILINSVPYHVLLSPTGEIEKVNEEAKGHMRGYKKSREEFIFEKKDIADSDILEGNSVRSSRVFLDFESGYATMDNLTTIELDKIADNYVPGKSEKLLISAFKASEDLSNQLFDNRISSIRTYLELKGVPSADISSEILVSSALADRVSITYVEE